MNLTIPVYIEEHKVADDPNPQFRLRPLFFAGPVKGGRQLSAGMSKLAQAVRHHLDQLGQKARQEELIPWTFSPALAEHRLKVALHLRRQTAEGRFLVVAFDALGRKLELYVATGRICRGRNHQRISGVKRQHERSAR